MLDSCGFGVMKAGDETNSAIFRNKEIKNIFWDTHTNILYKPWIDIAHKINGFFKYV